MPCPNEQSKSNVGTHRAASYDLKRQKYKNKYSVSTRPHLDLTQKKTQTLHKNKNSTKTKKFRLKAELFSILKRHNLYLILFLNSLKLIANSTPFGVAIHSGLGIIPHRSRSRRSASKQVSIVISPVL